MPSKADETFVIVEIVKLVMIIQKDYTKPVGCFGGQTGTVKVQKQYSKIYLIQFTATINLVCILYLPVVAYYLSSYYEKAINAL